MPKFPQTTPTSPDIYGGRRGTAAYRSELSAMRSGGASAASNAAIDFPDLTRPWSSIAPPRGLSPSNGGPIWRDTMNMIPRDGLMRRRPGIVNFAPGGPIPALTAGTNFELPVYIYNYVSPLDQQVGSGSIGGCGYTTFAQPTALTILVTNRQAYIYNQGGGGSWKNVTPTYITGTISVTNGSANVTGAGTNWLLAGVTGFNHIRIAGVWYQICVVSGAGALTLRTPYAGATAAGLAYTIQRTWDFAGTINESGINNLIYTCLFNQNLYIAGNFIGGSAFGAKEPAVIRVSGIFGAAPQTNYIVGRTAANPGMDNLPTLSEITGIQCLQDGRVVLSGATDTSEGVIFYSSDLLDTVWSVAPAGQTVIVAKAGPIYALGKLGNDLTLHYADGVVLGIPTGLADPPLAFQNTAASVGCYAPRTLCVVGGVEVFVSQDANVFTFDKTRTQSIGDEIRTQFGSSNTPASYLKNSLHAAVNHRWNEYTLYAPVFDRFGGNSGNTLAYAFRIDEGSWWQLNYPMPIGAAGDSAPTTSDYGIIGVYSDDNGTTRTMMYTLDSQATGDGLWYSLATFPTYLLETDDMDFGGATNYKTADSAIVFMRGFPSAGTASLQLMVSRDGGTTWVTSASKTLALQATGETPLQFSFRDTIGAGLLLRYRLVLGAAGVLNFAPTRLLIEADIGIDCGVVQL